MDVRLPFREVPWGPLAADWDDQDDRDDQDDQGDRDDRDDQDDRDAQAFPFSFPYSG